MTHRHSFSRRAFAWVAFSITLCASAALARADDAAPAAATKTIYAAPAAAGDGSGRDAANAAMLDDAIKAIGDNPARVILLDGVYRQFVEVPSGPGALTIEAQHPRKAIITGSDLATDVTPLDGGLLAVVWPHKWGINRDQFYFPGERTRYNQRREMVFFDGKRLTQRVTEDNVGSGVDPKTLSASEFTVDEGAGKIFLKPPADAPASDHPKIELALRGYNDDYYPKDAKTLFEIHTRSNVTLKGLVVQHAANYILAHPAVQFDGGEGKDVEKWPHAWRVEDCAIVNNNGVGLGFGSARDVTIVHSDLCDNGERGGGGGQLRDVLVEDCNINDNGWRFGRWLVGHDMAGLKFFDGADSDGWFKARSNGITIRRCTFHGNQCIGVWQDFAGPNTLIEDCLFEDSPHSAVMQEITAGPLTISRCVVRRCGTYAKSADYAFTLVGSTDVSLLDCVVYDCGNTAQKDSGVFTLVDDTRKSFPAQDSSMKRLRVDRCVIQANRTSTYLFRAGSWNGAPNARTDWPPTMTSNHNTWFNADRPGEGMDPYKQGVYCFFDAKPHGDWRDSYPDLSFVDWQRATFSTTGQHDQDSKWEAVDLKALEPRNPPAEARAKIGR